VNVNERFAEKMADPAVAHDAVVIADLTAIWCDGHHRDRSRRQARTEGAVAGIYGRRRIVLCEECEAHLAYAEKRRAYCPKEPKPFCANCDTHCYKSDEREWQREMMRYSGPRSWRKGHAIDGIRHVIESHRHKKHAEKTARQAAATASRRQDEPKES